MARAYAGKRRGTDPRQLVFDFTDTPTRDIREIVTDLFAAADKLRLAYDQLRATAQDLAGCDLSDWSLETLEAYVELALAQARYGQLSN